MASLRDSFGCFLGPSAAPGSPEPQLEAVMNSPDLVAALAAAETALVGHRAAREAFCRALAE
jgi:hypothetical protein